jgi:hypothetical protein
VLRFWLVIIAVFVALLVTVNYVSLRSSQQEAVESDPVPAAAAPESAPPAYQAPRSYSPSATPNALYKCVDAAGHQSFQSQPCASGTTQAWVRDATPEPEPSPEERRRRARVEQREQRQVAASAYDPGYSSGSGSTAQAPGSSAACQAARAADAAYRRQPLRYVTHDGLRRLGDQVNAACY